MSERPLLPNRAFMQMCWVVPDLEAAIDGWVRSAGVGPFFWFDEVVAPGKTEFDISATSEQLLSNVTRLAVSFEDAPATAQSKPSEFVLSGFCVKLW